jgi:hypothetical protein
MNGVTARTEVPSCYGKPGYWDKNAPECAGGPDTNFVNPRTGKNVRDQCSHFNPCGTRAAMHGIIPAQQLLRPPVVPPPPVPSYQPYQPVPPAPPAPPVPPPHYATYMARAEAESRAALGQPPQPPYVGGWSASYAVPSFLSVQEMRHPGESWWAPFGRMALRGIGKAIGMVFAHWWDVTVLKLPPEKKE